MLIAGLGVIAALGCVLGLGAICLWVLKRWGAGALGTKSCVPVEVVQRVPLGPKTGLAVVRVGEKVMALSVGEGGVWPLFELDDADRQRVIASSMLPVPFVPSAGAAEVPRFLTPLLTTSRGTPVTYAPATAAPAVAPAVASAAASPTTSNTVSGDLDFRAMLSMSLSQATRLAVLAGLVMLGGGAQLRAQGAPQAPPPSPASPASLAPPAKLVPPVPPVPPVPRPGNGAQLTKQAAAARRPVNDVMLDSTPNEPRQAQAATPAPIAADDAIMRMMPQMDMQIGGDGESGGLRLNGTVGIVVMMGLLTLLPTLLLMMTGFTRILIVLHFLKQAMGTQSAPPAHLLGAMALLLTGFVMGPTLTEVNRTAITPWLDGQMSQVDMMRTGVKPMRDFMLKQTRESDLKTFVELSRMPGPATIDDVPLHVLMSAFVASELRTAFQIGFAIYLPFIIIDAVVASVLMSMGMFMLPPAMISLPFKLLLFVLVDGWSLTITSLVQSFK
ncbi:flagellar type III secretion system pore protein FliP [Gemmatimonas sp.]|uniref:flagellar type III secretion system pore protein FliP n=1 Tax=Gemmatimonas sp. TaxID=1962908 RepID=UPI00391D0C9B